MYKIGRNLTTLQIMQLQRILEHQLTVRRSLEKELGYESLSQNIAQETNSMPEVSPPVPRSLNDIL